jgi:hypothetical protein
MKDLYFKVLQHKATIPASVGVASFAAGFGAALAWQKYQERKTEELMERAFLAIGRADDVAKDLVKELESFQKHPSNQKPEEDGVAVPTVSALQLVVNRDEDPEEETVESQASVISNIFDGEMATDGWDVDAELASRSVEAPYIIHVEEFINDERGFSQTTLTYYQGDDILCDDRDTPIYDRSIVGELKFGHGSNDRNVVYIRNEKLRGEYEVLLDHGSYQHEVLGQHVDQDYETELKHSVPRFRPE